MHGVRLRHELLVAWVYLAIMAASALPTPLYSLYRQRLGLPAIDITVVYAFYALVVLVTLLWVGFLSDRIGRRPVMLLAVALAAVGEIVLMAVPTLAGLYLSRGLTGVAVGLAISALPAYLADLAGDDHAGRATMLGVAANMGGQALGTFLAGMVSGWAPNPLVAPYVVGLILLSPVFLLAVTAVPETVSPARITGQRQQQEKRIPAQLKTSYRATAATLVAAFAMFGFLTAMTSQILEQRMHVVGTSTAGTVTAALFVTGAVGQLLAGVVTSSRNPAVAVIPLPIAAVLLSVAVLWGSLLLFAVAVVVCGFGGGISLRGGSIRVLALSPVENRAHVSSRLFAALYLGASVPTIAAGLLATTVNIVVSIFGLALLVVVLAAGAAVLLGRLPAADEALATTDVLFLERDWTDAATVRFFPVPAAPVVPHRRDWTDAATVQFFAVPPPRRVDFARTGQRRVPVSRPTAPVAARPRHARRPQPPEAAWPPPSRRPYESHRRH